MRVHVSKILGWARGGGGHNDDITYPPSTPPPQGLRASWCPPFLNPCPRPGPDPGPGSGFLVHSSLLMLDSGRSTYITTVSVL